MKSLGQFALLLLLLSGGMAAAWAADETITVIARFYPAVGREAELASAIQPYVEMVRSTEPDTRVYQLLQIAAPPLKPDDPVPPAVLVVYEQYPSKAAFELHVQHVTAYRQAHPAPPGLMRQPPEVQFFSTVADARR